MAEGNAGLGEGGGEGRGERGVGCRYRGDDGNGKRKMTVAGEEDHEKSLLREKEKEQEKDRRKEIDKERLKEERGRRVLNSLDLVETLVSCCCRPLAALEAGCFEL